MSSIDMICRNILLANCQSKEIHPWNRCMMYTFSLQICLGRYLIPSLWVTQTRTSTSHAPIHPSWRNGQPHPSHHNERENLDELNRNPFGGQPSTSHNSDKHYPQLWFERTAAATATTRLCSTAPDDAVRPLMMMAYDDAREAWPAQISDFRGVQKRDRLGRWLLLDRRKILVLVSGKTLWPDGGIQGRRA